MTALNRILRRMTVPGKLRKTAFNPASLFANGEQGWWYDPSNTATLFQDAAGTTPVTAMEQPVGLQLDLSGRGNHRRQTTSANRPVVSARVNLLEKTEDLSNAYWTVTGWATRVVSGAFTTLTENTSNSVHSVTKPTVTTLSSISTQCTITTSLKAGTRRYLQFQFDNGVQGVGIVVDTQNWTISNLTGAGTVTASSITPLGDGEYRVSVTGNYTTGTGLINAAIYGLANSTQNNVVYTGDGSTIIAGKIDLRVANIGVGLPAYQRVNTSTDYDSTGFPTYIKPNGSNQFMVTNSINFSATDKMTVWQGVRKLSDAAAAILTELSVDASSNNGTFNLLFPRGATINNPSYTSRGTSGGVCGSTANNMPSPITNVLTALSDISADSSTLRVNGVIQATQAADQGTGNYGNYPAYFYMRAGTSLPFNGHDYGSIARGAASTAAQITAGETYINSKTKAF